MPLEQHGALQRRQVVDEHLAFQVIHLVLDAHRQRALGLHDDLVAIDVLRLHLDLQRAGDVGVEARKRQAALLIDLGALSFRGSRR